MTSSIPAGSYKSNGDNIMVDNYFMFFRGLCQTISMPQIYSFEHSKKVTVSWTSLRNPNTAVKIDQSACGRWTECSVNYWKCHLAGSPAACTRYNVCQVSRSVSIQTISTRDLTHSLSAVKFKTASSNANAHYALIFLAFKMKGLHWMKVTNTNTCDGGINVLKIFIKCLYDLFGP